jgi:opacity protein-like surface antigen
VGTTAANFLTIPVGPRATGMGGAFTAIANDATTAFWNAGGLSRVPRSELTFAYTEWLVETKFNWLGFVFKLDEDNAFSLFVNQLDYGEENVTVPGQEMGTGEKWRAEDIVFGLSYGRSLTDRFSIGGTVKYISQSIWNENATAFAVDVGLLFFTPLEGLSLGANISNFGTEMKLEGRDLLLPADVDPARTGNNSNISSTLLTDSWPIPLVFAVGLAYDAVNNEDWRFTVATDVRIPSNQSTYFNLGSELVWANVISLRVGYNKLLLRESDSPFEEGAEVGLTAGVGVQYDFGGFFAKFDYSYSDFGIFDQISRFSLSVGI